jgi:hypothetical protein
MLTVGEALLIGRATELGGGLNNKILTSKNSEIISTCILQLHILC